MKDVPTPSATQQQQQQYTYSYYFYNDLPGGETPPSRLHAVTQLTGPVDGTVAMGVLPASYYKKNKKITGDDDVHHTDGDDHSTSCCCTCCASCCGCCAERKPFPLVHRITMYSILFGFSLLVLIFCCLSITARGFTSLSQGYGVADTQLGTKRYYEREVVALSLFSSCSSCKYFTENARAAMDPKLYPGDTGVRPNSKVRIAGSFTVVVLILSGLLMVLSVVGLVCAVLHRRRWQQQQQQQGEEKEGRGQREAPSAARLRKGLGIACLLLVLVGLAFTAGNLGVSMRATFDFYDASDSMYDVGSIVTGVSTDGVMESVSVWTQVANLILLFILSVMLCVPALSGIADRQAVAAAADTTEGAAAEAESTESSNSPYTSA